jgi:hypothetical protein
MATMQPTAQRAPTLMVLPEQRPTDEPLPLHPTSVPAQPATAELRDRLTRAHLRAAPESPTPGDVIAFRARWWDGTARVPSVVLRLPDGDRRRRCRLVETGGRVIALPASSWQARRALRRLRRPVAVEPALRLLRQPEQLDIGRPRVSIVRSGRDVPAGRPTLPRRSTGPRQLILIEQAGDAVRCERGACAGLVPVLPPGRLAGAQMRCPRCGGAAS